MGRGGGRASRAGVGAAWAATVVIAGGVGWWAADATLQPPEVTVPAAEPATYTVSEGVISRVFEYTASAEWLSRPQATNAASGTVTSVEVSPGQAVGVGDAVYSINERPVVAAVGAVPMYRDLSVGAEGRDVQQVQEFLADQGYYQSEPSGTFTNGTAYAVRAWQRGLGVPDDGVVRRGDFMFAPELPVRVLLDDGIAVGREISPGSDAIAALSEAPEFTVTLSQEQLDLVPLDAIVMIEHEGGSWPARIDSVRDSTDEATMGQAELVLAAAEGDGSVCGSDCVGAVPVGQVTRFRARVVVIPETSGPVVPAAALRTDPSGDVSVVTAEGDRVPVRLLARDSGQAVVDGLDIGTRLLLFGEQQTATSPDDESAESDGES